MKAGNVEFYADMSCVNNGMHSSTRGGTSFQDSQFMLADNGIPSFSDNAICIDKASMTLSTCASYMSHGDQSLCVKDERDDLITPYKNNLHNAAAAAEFNVGLDRRQLLCVFPSMGCQSFKPEVNNFIVVSPGIANHYQDMINGTASKLQGNMGNMNLKAVDRSLPYAHASIASEKQLREKEGAK